MYAAVLGLIGSFWIQFPKPMHAKYGGFTDKYLLRPYEETSGLATLRALAVQSLGPMSTALFHWVVSFASALFLVRQGVNWLSNNTELKILT